MLISGKGRRSGFVALATLALMLATLMPPAVSAASGPCQAAVSEHLERLGIKLADVRKVSLQARRQSTRNGGTVIGFDAWVDLKTCEGSLVLRMTRSCRVQQAYGRGACEIPGQPQD